MRQPPASWQTDAFAAVWAQTRLQQVEQPGHGSPSIVQLPVVAMAPQVPAVLPVGTSHLPLQHSAPEKQTSPRTQLCDAVSQLPMQQSPSRLHISPGGAQETLLLPPSPSPALMSLLAVPPDEWHAANKRTTPIHKPTFRMSDIVSRRRGRL